MLYQTHARIHLGNIRDNLLNIRRNVGEQRKILIAVKANAYGHGSIAISRMAQMIGIDWLGVATVPEAQELRQAGIKLPILKFSPAFPEEMEAAIQADVTLSICTLENAHLLNRIAGREHKRINVHLKIDTGMGRIGVSAEEASTLAANLIKECPNLNLQGVFTHLPVSDENDATYTKHQIEQFRKIVTEIEERISRRIEMVHCANSGGILGHQDSWLNMVRPGIMMYGFYPSPETPKTIPLLPGLSFYTRVSFIKQVKKGTPIGYGSSWKAPEDTWVATIPAGYADGFNRLFSNSGRVLINGKSYPIIGRVCMDQSMVNLGPSSDVQVGDQVVLIGSSGHQEITAYEWAEKLKTITYEVTCQINARVDRIYDDIEEPARSRWHSNIFE